MIAEYRLYINRDLPLHERACTSKVPFASRREARAVARHGRHIGPGLEPYHCPWCGAWHNGHRRRRHG